MLAFIALFITLSLSSSAFFTSANMKNLAFQATPVGIIAAGGTLVFIAGGFDLSVGAVSGFAAIMCGKAFLHTGVGTWGSFIVGALVGLACGLGNGLADHDRPGQRVHRHAGDVDHHLRVRPGRHRRQPRLGPAERFAILGLGTACGINNPVFVWIGFALFCGFLLSRRRSAAMSTRSAATPRRRDSPASA